jgi:hypothetical protein
MSLPTHSRLHFPVPDVVKELDVYESSTIPALLLKDMTLMYVDRSQLLHASHRIPTYRRLGERE